MIKPKKISLFFANDGKINISRRVIFRKHNDNVTSIDISVVLKKIVIILTVREVKNSFENRKNIEKS